MSKIVIIGAGKTGRGFIGRLIGESNIGFSFVDKDKKLVTSLNSDGYSIHFFGDVRKKVSVSNYKAYTWDDADFSDTELIFVSVGGSNLEDVGVKLKSRLDCDKVYHIITCENCSSPAQRLKNAIAAENVYVSESTVFCTTIEESGLNISSENYPYLQCDADLLNGYIPKIKAVKAINNFGNFLTRKLFTYNAASCIIAYLGWLDGYTDYAKAANDKKILALLDKNYAITNRVLCEEFGYDRNDQEEFAVLSRNKFTDKTIIDTVARNAREPQRKLGSNERIIGPMKLIEKYGEDPSILQKTAAAMLIYDNEGEEEWKKIKQENPPEDILVKISDLEKGSNLHIGIMKFYREIIKKRG